MSISQQAFLRDAMRRLNLTRDVFAARIGVKRRALDTWLLPEGSQEFRAMPEVVATFSESKPPAIGIDTVRQRARTSAARSAATPS